MKKFNQARVILGIPTTKQARRSSRWIDALAGLNMPLGSSLGRRWVEDERIADARNLICREALNVGADYVFFVSDDVLPPANALLIMLDRIGKTFPTEEGKEARASMISGIYWTKTYPSEPYIWMKPGLDGSYRKWKAGEWFPVDLAGCDCLLIETAMLRQIPPPWFSTEWLWGNEPKPSSIATEDFYFFTKARLHGFRLFADTSIQCLHEDRENGELYGLKDDFPQAGGLPEFGDEKLMVADLGSGTDSPYFGENCTVIRFDGRQDVRPDVRCDITQLPEQYHGKFDKVHTRHVLEHFGRAEAPDMLQEWMKLLKPDGELIIRVPNFGQAITYVNDYTIPADARQYAWAQIYGGQNYPLDFHKNGFTERKLLGLLKLTPGLKDAKVEIENDGLNLKGTATFVGFPPVDSIGRWWDTIDQKEAETPELASLEYENLVEDTPPEETIAEMPEVAAIVVEPRANGNGKRKHRKTEVVL